MIVRLARQNWPTAVGSLLVLWLIIGLPVLGYGDVRPALASHIALAMALGVLIALASVLQAANLLCGFLGVWLAASPWLIGYAASATPGAINDLLTGMTLVALSAAQRRRLAQLPHRWT